MFSHDIQLRVRYGETDQMGYAYYGNYATYFEVARVETLRFLGLSYKKMEEDGILLPVLSYSTQYLKPAFYDDLLTIRTIVEKMPEARITFRYEVYNEAGTLLNKAETTLAFIQKETGRPRRLPDALKSALESYFR